MSDFSALLRSELFRVVSVGLSPVPYIYEVVHMQGRGSAYAREKVLSCTRGSNVPVAVELVGC